MQQSSLLNLARGSAALIVLWAHLRDHLFPDYKAVVDPTIWFKVVAFVAGFAGQAVIVFFVMSGWLVGGTFLSKVNRQSHPYLEYAVDRLTRLWTVLVPTFLLSLVLHVGFDAPAMHGAQTGAFSAATFVGNLLGLQTVLTENYAQNYPLWSLANETAYYVLFPLLVFACVRQTPIGSRLGAVLLIAAYAFVLTPGILSYFSIWLVGVAASKLRLPPWAGIASLIGLSAASLLMRIYRVDGNLMPDFSVGLLAAIALAAVPRGKDGQTNDRMSYWSQGAAWLASFSFTLYVTHVPIIYFIQRRMIGDALLPPSESRSLVLFGVTFISIVSLAYGISFITERRTLSIRNFLKHRIKGTAPSSV
jgi:peptidoglycan/LPS O-acetylase OafA/YrhL